MDLDQILPMKLSKIALNRGYSSSMIKDPFVSFVGILGLQKIHSLSPSKVNHVKKQKHDLDLRTPGCNRHHPDDMKHFQDRESL